MEESKSIIKVQSNARFEELSYLTEEDKNYVIENENEIDVDSIFSDIDEEIRKKIKELIERLMRKIILKTSTFIISFISQNLMIGLKSKNVSS